MFITLRHYQEKRSDNPLQKLSISETKPLFYSPAFLCASPLFYYNNGIKPYIWQAFPYDKS